MKNLVTQDNSSLNKTQKDNNNDLKDKEVTTIIKDLYSISDKKYLDDYMKNLYSKFNYTETIPDNNTKHEIMKENSNFSNTQIKFLNSKNSKTEKENKSKGKVYHQYIQYKNSMKSNKNDNSLKYREDDYLQHNKELEYELSNSKSIYNNKFSENKFKIENNYQHNLVSDSTYQINYDSRQEKQGKKSEISPDHLYYKYKVQNDYLNQVLYEDELVPEVESNYVFSPVEEYRYKSLINSMEKTKTKSVLKQYFEKKSDDSNIYEKSNHTNINESIKNLSENNKFQILKNTLREQVIHPNLIFRPVTKFLSHDS